MLWVSCGSWYSSVVFFDFEVLVRKHHLVPCYPHLVTTTMRSTKSTTFLVGSAAALLIAALAATFYSATRAFNKGDGDGGGCGRDRNRNRKRYGGGRGRNDDDETPTTVCSASDSNSDDDSSTDCSLSDGDDHDGHDGGVDDVEDDCAKEEVDIVEVEISPRSQVRTPLLALEEKYPAGGISSCRSGVTSELTDDDDDDDADDEIDDIGSVEITFFSASTSGRSETTPSSSSSSSSTTTDFCDLSEISSTKGRLFTSYFSSPSSSSPSSSSSSDSDNMQYSLESMHEDQEHDDIDRDDIEIGDNIVCQLDKSGDEKADKTSCSHHQPVESHQDISQGPVVHARKVQHHDCNSVDGSSSSHQFGKIIVLWEKHGQVSQEEEVVFRDCRFDRSSASSASSTGPYGHSFSSSSSSTGSYATSIDDDDCYDDDEVDSDVYSTTSSRQIIHRKLTPDDRDARQHEVDGTEDEARDDGIQERQDQDEDEEAAELRQGPLTEDTTSLTTNQAMVLSSCCRIYDDLFFEMQNILAELSWTRTTRSISNVSFARQVQETIESQLSITARQLLERYDVNEALLEDVTWDALTAHSVDQSLKFRCDHQQYHHQHLHLTILKAKIMRFQSLWERSGGASVALFGFRLGGGVGGPI